MKSRFSTSKAFTIVELLIVIVIIGILATIVIVAYNGVQASARDKSVMSDIDELDGLETRCGLNKTVCGISSSLAGEAWYSGNGPDAYLQFTPSSGDVIDIVVNSTDYCIRGYNPNSGTYKTLATAATKASTPGVCTTLTPSLVAQGYITNLVDNPSVESGVLAPNSGYFGPPMVVDSSTAAYGTQSIHVTTNSTTYPQGTIWQASLANPNTQYTCSLSLKGTSGNVVTVAGRATAPGGAYIGEGYGATNLTLSTSWQRVSITFTSPANTGTIYIQYHLTSALSGIDIWSDGAMCTSGSSVPKYADGSSPGWVWNGSANVSTSTGLPL